MISAVKPGESTLRAIPSNSGFGIASLTFGSPRSASPVIFAGLAFGTMMVSGRMSRKTCLCRIVFRCWVRLRTCTALRATFPANVCPGRSNTRTFASRPSRIPIASVCGTWIDTRRISSRTTVNVLNALVCALPLFVVHLSFFFSLLTAVNGMMTSFSPMSRNPPTPITSPVTLPDLSTRTSSTLPIFDWCGS
jgi:hypothetical protein